MYNTIGILDLMLGHYTGVLNVNYLLTTQRNLDSTYLPSLPHCKAVVVSLTASSVWHEGCINILFKY